MPCSCTWGAQPRGLGGRSGRGSRGRGLAAKVQSCHSLQKRREEARVLSPEGHQPGARGSGLRRQHPVPGG